MDSSIMKNNFTNSSSMLYGTHYVELASDKVTYEDNKGKFYMTYINPNVSTGKPTDTTLPKGQSKNVINTDDTNKLGVKRITSSNYVEIIVPKYLFYITDISVSHPSEDSTPVVTVKRKEYIKGQRFVVTNTNGDFNDVFIIGVLE